MNQHIFWTVVMPDTPNFWCHHLPDDRWHWVCSRPQFQSLGDTDVNCSTSSVLCWIGICGVRGSAELFTEIWKLTWTCLHCQIRQAKARVSCSPRVAALCGRCELLGFAISKALRPCKCMSSPRCGCSRSDAAGCPRCVVRGLYSSSFVHIQQPFVQCVTQKFPAQNHRALDDHEKEKWPVLWGVESVFMAEMLKPGKLASVAQQQAARAGILGGATLRMWGRLLAVGLLCPSPGGLICLGACRRFSQSLQQTKAVAQELSDWDFDLWDPSICTENLHGCMAPTEATTEAKTPLQ